ncbi:MAG: hypothetical protein Q9169_006348 [Polycauliona sp. 2 TL-2023]
MDYFRAKKQPDILDPLDKDFLKRKPAAASQSPQQIPQQGDLAPSSIFDEGESGDKPSKSPQPGQPRVSPRDPTVLAAALDPNPESRQRWQRNQIIRNVRNRGRLTKAQHLARTERESLSKSPFYLTSIKKLMPLARQIAGKPIEEAIVQMRFSKKKVARDVKKHLEYARDRAIVERGMGLGVATAEYNRAARVAESDDAAEGNVGQEEQWPGTIVEDKKGKRRYVSDTSSIYVDEAWVGRGQYGRDYDFRAKGRTNRLRPPETSITVRLKEETTRIRLMDEREQKRQRKRVWLPLPDRPVTAQRQYCLCHLIDTTLSTMPSSLSTIGAALPQKSTHPTIILVHGGWQGPETFSLLIPLLEKAGYSSIAVALPSSHSVIAVPDFSADVAIIRSILTSTLATGKDVVLVMHSYGAVPGCEALKGLKQAEADRGMETEGTVKSGKVVKLAFIAALLHKKGKATYQAGKGTEARDGLDCKDNLIRCSDGPNRFYNDLPPALALRWAARLKKHSRLAFASPVTYEAYRDFPSAYLACTLDQGVPYPVQQYFVAGSGITDVTTIVSGHCPMISQPRVVEGFVRRCAGEMVARL